MAFRLLGAAQPFVVANHANHALCTRRPLRREDPRPQAWISRLGLSSLGADTSGASRLTVNEPSLIVGLHRGEDENPSADRGIVKLSELGAVQDVRPET